MPILDSFLSVHRKIYGKLLSKIWDALNLLCWLYNEKAYLDKSLRNADIMFYLDLNSQTAESLRESETGISEF
jgi:hypothetical protein